MDRALTSEARLAICRHMNEDHADAVVAYARTYGNITGVLAAEMTSLDEQAMELAVDTAAGPTVTRIAFDHVLTDTSDARDTLISLARAAMTPDHAAPGHGDP
jgi:putative heme iron utilization protein